MAKKAVIRNKVKKVHPWRLCPVGEHWVRTHPLHMPPSGRSPAGTVTIRRAHCARNPSGKDCLYPEEVKEIASRQFSKLKNRPCPSSLKFQNGSEFDDLIAGWVRYWNDVFAPKESLDANLVRALIASESGFEPKKLADKKNANSARGLMQITNDSRKILGNEHGELKDHFITATRDELNDPNLNICAGVRWLFQKKFLASSKMGRPVAWDEAVANYKSVLKDHLAGNAKGKRNMGPFQKYLGELTACKKK